MTLKKRGFLLRGLPAKQTSILKIIVLRAFKGLLEGGAPKRMLHVLIGSFVALLRIKITIIAKPMRVGDAKPRAPSG
jgi:hypothetical protein